MGGSISRSAVLPPMLPPILPSEAMEEPPKAWEGPDGLYRGAENCGMLRVNCGFCMGLWGGYTTSRHDTMG